MNENKYHRYLKLPFEIIPPKQFKKHGEIIRHHYINRIPFPEVEKWLYGLDLRCFLKECFYTPPFSKIPIHTDHASYTNHAKINITWGPEEGVMQWWHSDIVHERVISGNTENTSQYHHNLWAEEKDCTLLYEANTNKVSLVNVGVLHGTNNPTNQGRWTLCFVPVKQDRSFIHWDDALITFKDYIEDL
jgi:hypothetical protein